MITLLTTSLAVLSLNNSLVEQHKLTAYDGAAGDGFGHAVSASGDLAVVGATKHDHTGTVLEHGSVYVFQRQGTMWNFTNELLPRGSLGPRNVGWSVSLLGGTAILGVFNAGSPGNSHGAAYVYSLGGGGWSLNSVLQPTPTTNGALFGASVGLASTWAVVGAPGESSGTGAPSAGAAYIVSRAGWFLAQRIVAPGASAEDFFGSSVAVAGETAIVGAPGHDGAAPNSGAAFVFSYVGGTWVLQANLTSPQALAEESFGEVARDGDTALVGAPGSILFSGPGAAYVFSRTGTVWSHQATLVAHDAQASDRFGASVALDGDRAVVGSPRHGNGGAAYAFQRVGTMWIQSSKLVGSDTGNNDHFGSAVAVTGTRALVGAVRDNIGSNQDAGSAYAFDLTQQHASFCDDSDASLVACPCNNPGSPDTGCEVHQGTGGVALVVACQQTAPLNQATLAGLGFPAGQTPASVVIRGTGLDAASPVVFGDGLRCVGVPLARLAATIASNGTALHTVGHGSMAGSGTFYYQAWFRNTPVTYCDSLAAFNLSNGRTLTW
jgi:hypothetical protein